MVSSEDQARRIDLTVGDGEAGRLDHWLDLQISELSRSRLQALIRDGHVLLDDSPTQCHRKVRSGMQVAVVVPAAAPVVLIKEPIPLDVLYEDDAVIVINKQAGLVVHPAAGHASGTLVNALLYHCNDLTGVGGELRPGIVHRLDKDTTGVMIVAKSEAAMSGLTDQFRRGTVRKEYLAIVRGDPGEREGRVETQIGRSQHDRKKMSAKPKVGRRAVTHYHQLEALSDAALLRVRIETGRTHQIRVHMAHIGHSILGDRQYGSQRKWDGVWPERQMLHAEILALQHPLSGKPMTWVAPMPADMSAVLAALRT